MCVPDMTLYPLIPQLVYALFGSMHRASIDSTATLVWALLLSQSLHPSDLARSLPGLRAARARQAFRRVRRIIGRAYLSSEYLTPFLLRAALHIVHDREVILVLDSTRCFHWEIFTLGILCQGRVLIIAWSILPYPWPKNSFTPTVVALLHRTLACWPEGRPVHLLADRGFPSLKFFRELNYWRRHLNLGYTIRLRAGDWVRLGAGQSVKIANLMAGIVLGSWCTWMASYQHRGKASDLALLVIGRVPPVYPAHRMGPADQARRQAREKRRIAHVLSKGQAQAPNTDTIWAVLSTEGDSSQAVEKYTLRFSTEGTYRDIKSWDLESVAAHETDSSHLDGLMGLAALGYFVQAVIGTVAGRAEEQEARARQEQWTTTDRVSVFWRGRQVLHDRGFDWRPWLAGTLPQLINRINPRISLRNHAITPSTYISHKEVA